MSSIPYSGGTVVNTTFTTTTGSRQEIVTGLEAQLSAAGWSTISGAGTGTVVMKSAVTASPKSNSIRVRLLDPGSGSCAQVKIENDAGTLTSQAYFLLPAAGKVFRVIASKYNFFVFNAQPSTARSFVCGGTLHIPDHLNGITTGDLGWIHGNAPADDATGITASFRTSVSGLYLNDFGGVWASQIWNNALTNTNSDSHNATHRLMTPADIPHDTNNWVAWSDDSYVTKEAVLGFGSGSTAAVCKWRGIIHNCMVTTKVYAGDSTAVASYDGHAWFAITDNCVLGLGQGKTGTLLVAIG
jgi:hypothetical protein